MPAEKFPDLKELAQHLRDKLDERKRFLLIYAHNGVGKTRLAGEFKDLGKDLDDAGTTVKRDTLYFNAFTEDLFNWDNDLKDDEHRVLKLNTESEFFGGLRLLELDNRIRPFLNRYADFDFRIDTEADKDGRLTKAEVVFFRKQQKDAAPENDPFGIKISRGEESIFIWCFFLAIMQLALDGAPGYEWVKHVYIDDPISSLDEHNAIVVGNHLIEVLREAKQQLPVVVSTHHALFFNVLHYEVKNRLAKAPHKYDLSQHMLKRDKATGGYLLEKQDGDTPRFYHVSALADLWAAAKDERVSTYHFNVLRSILEKTAFFHGYEHFSRCIRKTPDDPDGKLHQRFVDILSHGKYSMYEPEEMGEQTREYFGAILGGFLELHPFNRDLFPGIDNPDSAAGAAGVPTPVASARVLPGSEANDGDATSKAT